LSTIDQSALSRVRNAGDQVGVRKSRRNEALEYATAPTDIPPFDHSSGGLDGDDVVAGNDRRPSVDPAHVHAVGVIADVDHVRPTCLHRKARDEKNEFVYVAKPFPQTRGTWQALNPLRRSDDAQFAAKLGQLALEHAQERPHAGLIVRPVVAYEQDLQR
jgi:hypothetical protein